MFARVAVVLVVALAVWAGLVRPSSGAGHAGVYVVRPADTLWSIAVAHYAGDPREGVWAIERRNGLHATLIQPGERLVLP